MNNKYMRSFFILLTVFNLHHCFGQNNLTFYPASDSNIQYTGRIDFTNPALPRFWQPGVYIDAKFSGSTCEVILNDEVLWGKNQNYIEVVIDDSAMRLQTTKKCDTIVVRGLKDGIHKISIVKNTEANIGYLEFVGIRCNQLLTPDDKPTRKIEFYGNSITCGASADASAIPCGKGVWQDQHNAYLSYGAVTARTLNAQYHLSSVSGIGLMHSCCNLDIIIPKVYDKISMRNDTIHWDFNKYQPDLVTVCLGQNDGVQDSKIFLNNYVSFLKTLRTHYPHATIICLSSPMADETLRNFLHNILDDVIKQFSRSGDKKIYSYFFDKQYIHGCDYHPDIKEHAEIASLLSDFIRKKMNW
ncbi:MAG: SGNH/GDSL hydrolase family protein [Ferruginibacter sp.]